MPGHGVPLILAFFAAVLAWTVAGVMLVYYRIKGRAGWGRVAVFVLGGTVLWYLYLDSASDDFVRQTFALIAAPLVLLIGVNKKLHEDAS